MDPIQELPMGLGMALAQNPQALENFASMTEAQKQAFISRTHSVESKADMQALVSEIMQ